MLIKTLLFIALFSLGALGLNYALKENPPQNPVGAVVPCKDDTTKGVDQRIKECPVPANERASLKGKEIARLNPIGIYEKDGYKIEIRDVKAIPKGVELYARAWRGTEPLGFGKDGSVEWERHVIINPPVLIDDPSGTIIRNMPDGVDRKLREDPVEAIRQVVLRSASLVGKEGTQIVSGKVGNTILTAFPVAGTGTAPIDGQTQRSGVNEVFADIRAGAGVGVDNTSCCIDTLLSSSLTTDQYDLLYRAGFGFDTSSIGTDDIASSTLSFYSRTAGTDNGLGDTSAQIVNFTPNDGSIFVAGDHVNYGTTLFSDTSILISTADALQTYYHFTLNASGISNINKSGNSFFGRRLKWDVDNNFTGTWASDLSSNWQSFGADNAGTTQDPQLLVEHTVAAAVPAGEEYIMIWEE